MRLIDADKLMADVLTEWGCDPHYCTDVDIDSIKAWTDSLIIERINAQPTVTASPWHRVEDGLPPNAKHRGAFCPKYHVMTKWGVTDGWFNPDVGDNGKWRVLLWFFQGTWDEWDIDFERGDKPKLAWVSQRDVFAWMPIVPPKE